ncbi:hypothetical protein [Cryptosporangium sp. NPDC048952]|uniref:hypothetical protein n=1 Tax=Cryptosporangium sp. NPDC048952 TaxID=3363961 RepID=UPI00371B9B55
MKLATVAVLTALGVWGGLWAFQLALHLAGSTAPYRPANPVLLAGAIAAGAAIGWAVLLTSRPPSIVRASALGVLTVVLPIGELALLLPSHVYPW